MIVAWSRRLINGLGLIHNNGGVGQDYCGKGGAEPKAKALDLPVCVPTLTYGQEVWITIERMNSWIQADEIGLLHRVSGLSLRNKARSVIIWGSLEKSPCFFTSNMSVEVVQACD